MAKRAVITGATGMIGSALIRSCLNSSIGVTAIVRPDSPRIDNLPKDDRLAVVECEINDLKSIEPMNIQAEYFFHLAWVGSAPSGRDKYRNQIDNIAYTLDAVDLASKMGCSVFVGAGSQAEYGRVVGPLTCDTPCNPETGYGAAKLAAGQMSRLCCIGLGIRHEWARILSIYGPGDASHTLMMTVIENACRGEAPKCTSGEQVWDYLYSGDCADALLALALHGKDGKSYPVGSGKKDRLYNYIIEACKACDAEVEPNLGAVPYPENQVMNLYADITELSNDTGFTPSVSFEEGIEQTIVWHRRQRGSQAE